MKVVKTEEDTVRYEAVPAGDSFYHNGKLYLKTTGAGHISDAVDLETGGVMKFESLCPVRPAKAHIVVEGTGRVACGYNPR